jgi:hypothetical protein
VVWVVDDRRRALHLQPADRLQHWVIPPPDCSSVLALGAGRAPGREAIGFVEGVGVVLLTVWFLNRDYTPCPANGRLSIPASAPPGTSVSCGGFDARPWLLAGVLVSSLALAAYVVARQR